MTVKPLGSRLLIRPDVPAPVSDLIVMPDIATTPPEMSGTVIALGDGPERIAQYKREIVEDVRAMAARIVHDSRCIQDTEWYDVFLTDIARYAAQRPAEYEVKVGDRVLFPWNVGVKFTLDGEDYVTLSEEDVSAVFTDDEVVA